MNTKSEEKKLKKKIIILTGNETRHKYFKQYLANDDRFTVLKTYCEGLEKSLKKLYLILKHLVNFRKSI